MHLDLLIKFLLPLDDYNFTFTSFERLHLVYILPLK